MTIVGQPTAAARHPGRVLVWVAFGLGLLHASFSVYWGLGGTWLLDTIGGAIEAQGRAGDPTLRAIVWGTVALKLVAATSGVLATSAGVTSNRRRLVRVIAWAAASILIAYGGLLTIVGLLVQAGVIPAAPGADHTALAWHAYFWDPWFLFWGLALGGALWHSRSSRPIRHAPR